MPEERNYIRDEIVTALVNSIDALKKDRAAQNLLEVVKMKIFGDVTKLELLHFVLYHTQRHVHQLKKILEALKK